MEEQKVTHISLNSRYRIVFEKAASANKIDGFKVEANSDELEEAMQQAELLYQWAAQRVEATKPQLQVPEKEKK